MDAVVKGSPLSWPQETHGDEFPNYALRTYELNGRVWLTSASGPSPACVSFSMSDEQALHLAASLTAMAVQAQETQRMVRGIAEERTHQRKGVV